NLHTLNVSGETIDDDSLRGIGTLDGLARLTIHSPLITSEGVAHIAGIESLKELEISYGPNVDDEALEHLQNNPNLESLAIKYTAITDQGLLHLIEQQHLLHLTLVKQKISDEGLGHLANIKS